MSEVAAPTGDNGAVAGATIDATGTQAAAPAAAPANWYAGADELTTGFIQNKGWDTPLKAVESYKNLEKLFGADKAGRTVVLPGENATPEDMAAFYNRLGRPDTPDNYKLAIPEKGGDPEFAKLAAGKFHELGLTTKQGQELANWWNEHAGNAMAASEQQRTANFEADNASLKQEWGAAYDQKLVGVRNVAANLGLDSDTIDKLQGALGHKGVMTLLDKIGGRMGEDTFLSGGDKGGFQGAMTPAQAKAQIQANMGDKNFVSRYLNKDAGALAEMDRLHKYAYPEGE